MLYELMVEKLIKMLTNVADVLKKAENFSMIKILI